MRPVWKGTLVVGEVAVPVSLGLVASKGPSGFRFLHVECGTPIRQVRMCPKCGKELVRDGEVVRGFEFATGQFVVFAPSELESALKATRVELQKFVAPEVVSPVLYDRPHWVVPAEDAYARRAYAVISEAMAKTKLGGLGKLTLTTKEWPALVTHESGALLMRTLYVESELRPAPTLPPEELTKEELKLAELLVRSRQTPLFTPKRLGRWFAPKLGEIILAKQEGGEIAVPEPAASAPRNLEAALAMSVRRSKRRVKAR